MKDLVNQVKPADKPTDDIIPASAVESPSTKKPAAKRKPAAKKATPAKKDAVVPASSTVYVMGTGKYSPRVEHNEVAWSNVRQAITVKGKGKATHAELCEALKDHQKKTGEHHHDFIGYMERRHAIVRQEAKK